MSYESGANNANSPMREKHWAELDDAGKIERMRGEVKRMMKLLTAHDRGINLLGEHSHGPNGDLLIPMNTRRNMPEDGYRRSDDWF